MAEKEKGKRDERAGGSRPDDHRRKWDLAEYEKAAKAREDVEKAMNRWGSPAPTFHTRAVFDTRQFLNCHFFATVPGTYIFCTATYRIA